MLIVKTKLPKDVVAVALFPFVLVNKNKNIDQQIINHEKIHLRQQVELLIVFFYIWYGIEYLIKLIKYKNSDIAYRNISFEKEAYKNEQELKYLNKRKFFSFINKDCVIPFSSHFYKYQRMSFFLFSVSCSFLATSPETETI